jgi:RNA polymerase primary sigma factor
LAKTATKNKPIEERYSAVKQLTELGKEKGYLLHDEVYDMLPDEIVAVADELDEVYSRFDSLGVDVIGRPDRYQNRDDFDLVSSEFDKKDDDGPDYALSAHEKTNDPVRMYLREMGTVPLLDREGEVEIAQRIEKGEWLIFEALSENPVILKELLRLNEVAQKDKRVLRDLMASDGSEPLDAKAEERIKSNLKIFERIAETDKEIAKLRKAQEKEEEGNEEHSRLEREIDRMMAKIAKEIRSVDFSLQARNRMVEFLKRIDREFARFEQDIRRAETALDKGRGFHNIIPERYTGGTLRQ